MFSNNDNFDKTTIVLKGRVLNTAPETSAASIRDICLEAIFKPEKAELVAFIDFPSSSYGPFSTISSDTSVCDP